MINYGKILLQTVEYNLKNQNLYFSDEQLNQFADEQLLKPDHIIVQLTKQYI
jgi:hypothetical protein